MPFMDRFIHQPYASVTCPDTATRFATSWLLSPVVLFAWRALVSFYAFMVLFISIGLQMTHDGRETARRSFAYFTILGYWGLSFYYGVAAFHSATYWRRGRASLQSWPRPLRWAHSCFYSTVTVFPFIVTIIFWTLIANEAFATKFDSWINISQHALNSVLAFMEIVLARTNPPPWINLAMLIVLLGAYLGLAEVIHATQGWYTYGFLNAQAISGAGVFGACLVVLVGLCIIFAVVRYLIVFRQWLTEDKLDLGEQTVSRPSSLNDSMWEAGLGSCEMVPVEADSKEIKLGPRLKMQSVASESDAPEFVMG